MLNLFEKKKWETITILALMAYFAFSWLYKLNILPGLHGDEAWIGLKAYEFSRTGIDRITGMTYYTGILQTLITQLSFKLFGINVFQLRLPGAIINWCGLVLIIYCFIKLGFKKQAIYFLFIIGSSALFLASARVAWEVNSFTLFFISVSFWSLIRIHNGDSHGLWVNIFLLVNLIGTYDHVIYSSVSVAALCGLILWCAYARSARYSDLILLLAINVLNLCIVFWLMRYHSKFVYDRLLPFLIVVGLCVFLEYRSYLWLKRSFTSIVPNVPTSLIHYILILPVFAFAYFHGVAFFEVVSNTKVMILFYSYESSALFQLAYLLIGLCFISYFIINVLSDIKKKMNAAPAFVILCYLGVLCIYTTQCSFRYYLILYILMAIYFAFKIDRIPLLKRYFISSQLVVMILLNIQLVDIFTNSPIPAAAIDFTIGNGQHETSAHFLPKEPLINFLKQNQIGQIEYLAPPYFIEKPVMFYQLFENWPQDICNSAIIDYEYSKYDNGFYMFKKP